MIKLSKKQIIYLHTMQMEATGGIDGLRDEGLLESALNAPFQTFDGMDLYPTIPSKCAVLCYSLINNHPFLDGNKRIGIFVLLTSLELNGISLSATDAELVDLGFAIAKNECNIAEITQWILNHWM